MKTHNRRGSKFSCTHHTRPPPPPPLPLPSLPKIALYFILPTIRAVLSAPTSQCISRLPASDQCQKQVTRDGSVTERPRGMTDFWHRVRHTSYRYRNVGKPPGVTWSSSALSHSLTAPWITLPLNASVKRRVLKNHFNLVSYYGYCCQRCSPRGCLCLRLLYD